MAELPTHNTTSRNSDSAPPLATEIVFVDSAASDTDDTVQSILASSTSDGIQVVYLDTEENGVESISRVLSEHMDCEKAHIVANGSEGQLQLGNVYLCDANIGSYAGRIAAWQMALANDAKISIYGCDLDSKAGGVLIEDLRVLTAASVTSGTSSPSEQTTV